MPQTCRSRDVGSLTDRDRFLSPESVSMKPQDRADFSCSTSLQSTLKTPLIFWLEKLIVVYLSSILTLFFQLKSLRISSVIVDSTIKPHSPATSELPHVSALQWPASINITRI